VEMASGFPMCRTTPGLGIGSAWGAETCKTRICYEIRREYFEARVSGNVEPDCSVLTPVWSSGEHYLGKTNMISSLFVNNKAEIANGFVESLHNSGCVVSEHHALNIRYSCTRFLSTNDTSMRSMPIWICSRMAVSSIRGICHEKHTWVEPL
jgi:hypothetical protein